MRRPGLWLVMVVAVAAVGGSGCAESDGTTDAGGGDGPRDTSGGDRTEATAADGAGGAGGTGDTDANADTQDQDGAGGAGGGEGDDAGDGPEDVPVGDDAADAGGDELAVVDTAVLDTAIVDQAAMDAAVVDTAVVDTAVVDTVVVDAAIMDAAVLDVALEALVTSDGGLPPCPCQNFQTCSSGGCRPYYHSTTTSPALLATPLDVAVAATDGSFAVAGVFSGTVDFDPGPAADLFTAVDGGDVYVSRYNAAGGYLWTRTVASPGDQTSVHLDSFHQGGVVLAGTYRGSAQFFPGRSDAQKTSRSPDADEGYVLQFLADGSFRYVTTLPAGFSVPYGVQAGLGESNATPLMGSVLVFGAVGGGLVDWGTSTTYQVADGGFAATLTPEGRPVELWVVEGARVRAAASYFLGNVAMAGDFSGTIDLAPSPSSVLAVSSGPGRALYLATMGGAGLSIPMGATEVIPRSVTFRGNGFSLAVSGEVIGGTIPLDGGSAPQQSTAAGGADAFVLAFTTPPLALAWGRTLGGTGDERAVWVGPGAWGFSVLGTFSSANLNFGTASAPDVRQPGEGNTFIWSLGEDGAIHGTRTLGGPEGMVTPVFLRPGFADWMGGFFTGTVDFNPDAVVKDQHRTTGKAGFVSKWP